MLLLVTTANQLLMHFWTYYIKSKSQNEKIQHREAESFLKCRCCMKYLLTWIMHAPHCWQDRMVGTPCSWFSTFHSPSCSPSLPSTILFIFFFIATTMWLKLNSPSPYLIPKTSCCGSLWNQSGMPDPREAAGQCTNSHVTEMKAPGCPACLSQPLCEWWAPQMRHGDSKNS